MKENIYRGTVPSTILVADENFSDNENRTAQGFSEFKGVNPEYGTQGMPTETVTITENGTYDVKMDKTAIVSVNTEGHIINLNDTPLSITNNGQQTIVTRTTEAGVETISGNTKVSVNVPASAVTSGTKYVSNNGTTDVTNYKNVNVQVPASAVTSGTKNITANGTSDVTTYKSVVVNVPNPYDGVTEALEDLGDNNCVYYKLDNLSTWNALGCGVIYYYYDSGSIKKICTESDYLQSDGVIFADAEIDSAYSDSRYSTNKCPFEVSFDESQIAQDSSFYIDEENKQIVVNIPSNYGYGPMLPIYLNTKAQGWVSLNTSSTNITLSMTVTTEGNGNFEEGKEYRLQMLKNSDPQLHKFFFLIRPTSSNPAQFTISYNFWTDNCLYDDSGIYMSLENVTIKGADGGEEPSYPSFTTNGMYYLDNDDGYISMSDRYEENDYDNALKYMDVDTNYLLGYVEESWTSYHKDNLEQVLESFGTYKYYYRVDDGYYTTADDISSLCNGTYDITENGDYNIAGYEYVYVDVSSESPEGTYDIYSNGTYDISEYAEVNVDVSSPSGTYDIDANGTYDISEYAEVNVNVSATPEGLKEGSKFTFKFYGAGYTYYMPKDEEGYRSYEIQIAYINNESVRLEQGFSLRLKKDDQDQYMAYLYVHDQYGLSAWNQTVISSFVEIDDDYIRFNNNIQFTFTPDYWSVMGYMIAIDYPLSRILTVEY